MTGHQGTDYSEWSLFGHARLTNYYSVVVTRPCRPLNNNHIGVAALECYQEVTPPFVIFSGTHSVVSFFSSARLNNILP